MICYHGSDTVVDAPRILEAKRPLDFGGGFYVTSNKEQAVAWAKRVAYRNNSKKHYVNFYEFDLVKAEQESVVILFENGDIDKDLAIKRLKAEALSDQILFHTEKALGFLNFIEAEVITND